MRIIEKNNFKKAEKVIDVVNDLILGLVKADTPTSRENSPIK